MDENKDEGSDEDSENRDVDALDDEEEEELESYQVDEDETDESDEDDVSVDVEGDSDDDEKTASEVIEDTFDSRDPRDMMSVDEPDEDDSEGAEADDVSEEVATAEAGDGTDETDDELDDFEKEFGTADESEEADAVDVSDSSEDETDEDEGFDDIEEDVEVEGEVASVDTSDDFEPADDSFGGEESADTAEASAGLAGMDPTDVDEIAEDPADVSEFFGGRSEGGTLGSDLEGFFQAEEELEDEFEEDKLQVLMSQAKQGVAEFEEVEGFVEHERYWVNKPYAYIAILYSDAENDYRYWVVEPQLDDFEESVRRDLEERLRDVLMYEDIDDEMDEDEVLEEKAKRIIDDYGIDIDSDSMHKILYYLKRDYVYDGKIDPIMRDPNIEDISCDGDNVPIFVYHRNYRDLMTNVTFTREELESYVIKLAQKSGKHISVADPLVDASTPDGSRVQMSLGREVTDRGSTFTIRKFKDEPFTPIDLIKFNTFSLEQMAYLWLCIENNKSLIFAGGTASGKTTSMNAVTLFIPPKSKVVSIEDTREVTLPHMNWIPSVTRDSFSEDGSGSVDEYELLRAALRQRPEYLVVGEVRGEEALTLFQAMSTGHTTYSTMHADSVDSAIHRLENPPISVPRSMLKALDIVSIQAQTFVGGERVRRNMKLVEIIGIDPKTRNIRTDDIFQWDAETDSFIRTGNSTALQEIKRARGWSDEELERQLDRRREVLQYLLDNDIDGYEEVSKTIQSFIIDPDRILNQIREGDFNLEQLEELETLNI